MFDTLFQALFSYRPIVFQQGELRFNLTTGVFVAVAIAIALMVAAAITYRTVRGKGTLRDRLVLTAIRMVLLAIVVFCLLRPTLVVRASIPQQNVVAVLLDDSRSMQIPDWQGKARGELIREQFGAADRPLLKALSDRFLVRTFKFSSTPGRLGSITEMTFDGSQTKLGNALSGAREELAGLPVAGVILVTDGADTSEAALTDALLAMKAEKLPVFTVGVGSPQLARDIQVDRANVPKTVLQGAALLVDAVLTQSGYAGQTVRLDVEDDGQIIGSQEVRLPSDGTPASVRVRVKADDPGPRTFRFKVAPQDGEVVTQNNVRDALVTVRDAKDMFLFYEGEPRFEMKFLNRAVSDDKNLQVVTLQRTADNKYMRLNVDGPDELAGGFPKTREELFSYRGLVLGSVEAGAFTGDQLQMVADFVDKRGGGLLMLGGPRSFGEGGYGGTPVADALPLTINPATRASDSQTFERINVAPTRAGQTHSATQIAASEDASAKRWPQLPQVTVVNAPLPAKPGATVLLNGTDERGRAEIVMASQQYGRGKSLVFLAQDSWQWQMHASVPLEDMTHETMWRQMLRWLVDGVPSTVEVRTTSERVEPGEAITIEANVVDQAFVEVNDAGVVAHVTRPGGSMIDVPMQWDGKQDGLYRGTFVTTDTGAYDITVDAEKQEKSLGTGETHVRALPSDAEYFDPTMHEAPLRRIAQETGGRFYTPDTMAGLPEDVRYAGRGVTSVEERDLWNMPIVLMLLVGLMCAEWGYRRAVGLS